MGFEQIKILGFDIGGTKCAVTLAHFDGEDVKILNKKEIPTDLSVSGEKMISRLMDLADTLPTSNIDRIGISCGGPLDSKNGIILSPPNLPGWNNVKIADIIEAKYKIRPVLQNDANASAVAEWKFGAARGCRNAVFLTFGTGLGAGLILDGRLYEGTNGNAGEVGHIRLEDDGPIGYGKRGSFEGFCSGGGIARLGRDLAKKYVRDKRSVSFYKDGDDESKITAKLIAEAARSGDECAREIYRSCAFHLGRGLSIIIDILNPEVIVLGGIFLRSSELLIEEMTEIIEKEALAPSISCCRIVPAMLGESIGDFAAIAAGLI